jgi:hypothetical protein
MKSFYVIFVLAIIFDLIISPWLFGIGWLPKLVLILLPFAFIFLPSGGMITVFITTLLYWRIATPFNMGIIFLALILFLYYERWFIVNFFHKTAWQTTMFSGIGVFIFYLITLGASAVVDHSEFFFDWGIVLSCALGMIFGTLTNMFLLRIYRKNVV